MSLITFTRNQREEKQKKTYKFKTSKELKKHENDLFLAPTTAIVTKSQKEAENFFHKALKENVEGLMVKSLTASYKPGLRTGNMTKLKETMEDIDVVILAAEYGKGKRAGYYSSFFIGVKNQENHAFEEIGKVSSGIKELGEEGATLTRLTNMLKPLRISEEKNKITFEPKIILQVRFQEIQESSSYSSGYALRFPRIISLRKDKKLEEINTLKDIQKLINYHKQETS